MKKFGILGGGPSGLLASLFLKYPSQILEKKATVGGHAGSFSDQGFTFDYGAHIMFSKMEDVLNFMVSSLGKNVVQKKRENKVYYKGRLVKYPFENDLKSLPLEDNFDCLYHYLFNPYKKKYPHPKNLKEWLLYHFGKGICENYLFPYNEKVWNISVEKLSMFWASRIPLPPAEDIIKSAIGFETEGYRHQLYYYYPRRGGYQALSQSWAKRVPALTCGFEIERIKKREDGKWEISSKDETLVYDEIISTLPIWEIPKLSQFKIPQPVIKAISKLIVNPMYLACFGVKGKAGDNFTAIYFPEKDFPVNRASYHSNFSSFNAPPGHFSFQAEITCRTNDKIWRTRDADILKTTEEGLVKRGFLDSKRIVYRKLLRAKYAYVVYDTNFEKNIKLVREWFSRQGFHLLGRFSYFEYANVDMLVIRAKEIIGRINGCPIRLVGKKIIK